jgi:hypothetical protein
MKVEMEDFFFFLLSVKVLNISTLRMMFVGWECDFSGRVHAQGPGMMFIELYVLYNAFHQIKGVPFYSLSAVPFYIFVAVENGITFLISFSGNCYQSIAILLIFMLLIL